MNISGFLKEQNPWWEGEALPKEHVFENRRMLYPEVQVAAYNVADGMTTVLMGPRRVGKTVLLKQLVGQAISSGTFKAQNVCYVSFDDMTPATHTPKDVVRELKSRADPSGPLLVVMDEIQFCPDWERQVKVLTDQAENMKIVISGSAMADMRNKSAETGTGRFMNFFLPPLLFCEYLMFRGAWPASLPKDARCARSEQLRPNEVLMMNDEFVRYINHGAFPALVLDEEMAKNPENYLTAHAPDKDLLRAMPLFFNLGSLDKMLKLFEVIAKHNGKELSLSKMEKRSGISIVTLYKYLTFLESGFLIRYLSKLGPKLTILQKNSPMKHFFVNPSMNYFFNGKIGPSDEEMGHIVEATVAAQHNRCFGSSKFSREGLFFYRKKGNKKIIEADMVHTTRGSTYLLRLCEVKWSDNRRMLSEAAGKLAYIRSEKRKARSFEGSYCTTRSAYGMDSTYDVTFLPAAHYCATLGLECMDKVVSDTLGPKQSSFPFLDSHSARSKSLPNGLGRAENTDFPW